MDESSIPKTALTSPFGKYKYIKVPFRLAQAPAYFQELMKGVLKDFPFTIAYLDEIIIFSRTAEEHLDHIRQVFEKIWTAHLSMKLSKCHFFAKEIQCLGHILSTTGIRPLPSKTQTINTMHPPKTANQVHSFLGLVGYYWFIKDFAKMAKLLTLLTQHKAKFECTPVHHTAFMSLKEAITQAPILYYPDPARQYIVYMDALDAVGGAQLLQEHDGAKFPIAFLYHTFTETQRKWSTPEQDMYGVYYAITKWNYYLQGANIIVHNDHKPLAKFLNGKNTNDKDNRWGLELATYNITFEWISGARHKAADCLSRLVELPTNSKATIKMLTATNLNRPAFSTRSKTSHHSKTPTDNEPSNTPTLQDTVPPDLTPQDISPKSLTAD